MQRPTLQGSKHGRRKLNYARPWKVFLGAIIFVCCLAFMFGVAQEVKQLTQQENIEYHVNDLDEVDFEVPQVSPDWKFLKKAGNFLKKVGKGAVNFGKALYNGVRAYLGKAKCYKQRFSIVPSANPWDLGVAQQANYEKPLNAGGARFVRIAQKYINRMTTKITVLDAKFVDEWRILLFRDERTGYLWICFRGTKTMSNWINNANKFFRINTADLNRRYNRMSDIVKGWQRSHKPTRRRGYNRIYGFIGHSAGGFFTNQVATNWDVWRITLNAYDTQRVGRRFVNFRTRKDYVSALKSTRAYACLNYCNGAHGNLEFIKCWRNRYNKYKPTDYMGRWCKTYGSFCGRRVAPWVMLPGNLKDAPAPQGGALNAKPLPGGQVTGRRPVVANTRGFRKVFSCWGGARTYRQRWFVNPRSLVSQAKNTVYQFQFINPRNRRWWAMSGPTSSQWANNLARGHSLSYVPNGFNSMNWVKNNVIASPSRLASQFHFSCNNNALKRFPLNTRYSGSIYWGCGNHNGVHFIPQSRWCTWSWRQRYNRYNAMELWISVLGPRALQGNRPQAKVVRLRHWLKVFECSGNGRSYTELWTVTARNLISLAKVHKLDIKFVNPASRGSRVWAESARPNSLWYKNLRNGRALSSNGRFGISVGWTRRNIEASYPALKSQFAFRCQKRGWQRFPRNIYWACGNGRGFHVIPGLKLCRWAYNGGNEQQVEMYVKKIG